MDDAVSVWYRVLGIDHEEAVARERGIKDLQQTAWRTEVAADDDTGPVFRRRANFSVRPVECGESSRKVTIR